MRLQHTEGMQPKKTAAAMLHVSVTLTIASVKEVEFTAATHSQYMKTKTQKMRRLKGMRREMMRRVKR